MRQRTPFRRIGVEEARALLARSEAVALDDPDSFHRGHIETARNVSMANLDAVIQATPKSAPILICCYHGNASQEYAQIFSDFGFSNVHSVEVILARKIHAFFHFNAIYLHEILTHDFVAEFLEVTRIKRMI